MVWRPNSSEVRKSEIVGRRVYVAPIFDGDERLRVDHFFDNRLENDLSVDRLGEGQVVSKVKSHLAIKAGQDNSAHSFKGWAGLKVKSLVVPAKTAVSLLPTPLSDNVYHADISRKDYRTPAAAYALAFRLRDTSESDFTELLVDGKVDTVDVTTAAGPVVKSTTEIPESPKDSYSKFRKFISKFRSRAKE